jgi:hypothetical protein
MANEAELIYLVLLALLTLVIHGILSAKNHRHNRNAHR